MSKSLDNYIAITDTSPDMYGKVMSIPDSALESYFFLCTYELPEHAEEMRQSIAKGANPRDFKMKLAREIVAIYHGEKKAKEAEEIFINTFKKGAMPEEAPVVSAKKETLLADVLVKEGIIESKAEWRRLVTENAVSLVGTGDKIQDPYFKVVGDLEIKVGKRRFVKIVVE
jgi:tyrosyl-tRNA synthetase